jgi:hypothetical protein
VLPEPGEGAVAAKKDFGDLESASGDALRARAGSGIATDVSLSWIAVRKLGGAEGTVRAFAVALGPSPSVVDCGLIDPDTLAKNGSSSAIEPSLRGRDPPRDKTSSREIWT